MASNTGFAGTKFRRIPCGLLHRAGCRPRGPCRWLTGPLRLAPQPGFASRFSGTGAAAVGDADHRGNVSLLTVKGFSTLGCALASAQNAARWPARDPPLVGGEECRRFPSLSTAGGIGSDPDAGCLQRGGHTVSRRRVASLSAAPPRDSGHDRPAIYEAPKCEPRGVQSFQSRLIIQIKLTIIGFRASDLPNSDSGCRVLPTGLPKRPTLTMTAIGTRDYHSLATIELVCCVNPS